MALIGARHALRGLFAVWLALLPAGAAICEEAPGSDPLGLWLRGEGASGGWLGLRRQLSDRGIRPYAVWTGEVLRTFDGGLKRLTDWQGLLEFGIDLDLEAAVGWQGAGLHASALWIQDDADPSGDYTGYFDETSNIGAEKDVRAYRLYWTQELLDGALQTKLGQLVLDDDFMVSEGAALFLNASFGALPIQSANTPAPIFPIAALGGHARWSPTRRVSLQVGVYDGDAGTQDGNDDGFGYRFGSAEGAAVFAEAAIAAAPLGLETTCQLGGYYHSGAFDDFGSGETEWGSYALYVSLDQVLVGTPERSRVAAFVRAGISPLVDRVVVDWYLDAGITARGLRADDRVGLGFSHASFARDFVVAQERAGSPIREAESIVELTYSGKLTPWLALQPDLQYVIDPQDAAASDAFVGGIRVVVTF